MVLRGIIRGRIIELDSNPCLPDGSVVQVELKLLQEERLLTRLYRLWELEGVEPVPTLEEARHLAAQGLPPQWASQQILDMRLEREIGKP